MVGKVDLKKGCAKRTDELSESEEESMTIGDLIVRSAHKFPEKPAVVSEEASLTFRDLNERVNRLADYLARCRS